MIEKLKILEFESDFKSHGFKAFQSYICLLVSEYDMDEEEATIYLKNLYGDVLVAISEQLVKKEDKNDK